MAVDEGQVAVTDVAVQVVPPGSGVMRAGARSVGPTRYVMVKNLGPDTVYVGGTGVTAASGIPIASQGSFPFWIYLDEEIWAVCAATKTATAAFFQSGF